MSKVFSIIGQFFQRLFITLSVLLPTRNEVTPSEARRRQRREIRAAKRGEHQTMITPKQAEEATPTTVDEGKVEAQFTKEMIWAQKAVERYKEVVQPFPTSSIHNWPRFYQVEIVPPMRYNGCKMYAKAYVECRDTQDSAIVFLFISRISSKKVGVYKALGFYGNEIVTLDKPETIELAKRIFKPLLEAEAA